MTGVQTCALPIYFNPDQTFDPYAGAGVSYVRAMDNGLATTWAGHPVAAGSGIHIDRNMWGPALQAGVDVNLQDKWLVNFDVKKIWFNTDVFLNPTTKIDSLDIDRYIVNDFINSHKLSFNSVFISLLHNQDPKSVGPYLAYD